MTKAQEFLNLTEDCDFSYLSRFISLNEEEVKDADKGDFVRDLSLRLKSSYVELVDLFNNIYVIKLFQHFKWDTNNLFKTLYQGYTIFSKICVIMSHFVYENQVVEWTDSNKEKLVDFISKDTYLKEIKGVAVAAILLYLWFNYRLIREPKYITCEKILDAFTSDVSLADMLMKDDEIMSMFVQGFPTIPTFIWPGKNTYYFLVIVFGLLAKRLNVRCPKLIQSFYKVNKRIRY